MTIIKRILLIVLAAALVLSLAACGGEKNVEIRNVQLNEDKSMLSIEYVAKGDIPAADRRAGEQFGRQQTHRQTVGDQRQQPGRPQGQHQRGDQDA